MNVTALVSALKKDLEATYQISWCVSVAEAGEGDANLEVFPATEGGACAFGFNLYLFYTRLAMEFAVKNAPPIMFSVFKSVEENAKNNLGQIEAFEKLFKSMKGHLKYQVNGKRFPEIKSLSKNRWPSFSARYESEYLNVHYRLDFNYSEIRDHVLSFAGFILLFSRYQEVEELALHEEGKAYLDTSIRYERNPINRELCLKSKGYKCSVCGIGMEEVYGELGKGFIEVHHSNPVSEYGRERMIDPLQELFPVCPNCHAMLHRRKPPYAIKELKLIMKDVKKQKERK